MKVLTIAVSTLNVSASLLNKLAKYKELLDPRIEILVVSQGEEQTTKSEVHGIKVIKSDSIGLSKSRNIAIDMARTPWIWFQDDDFNPSIEKLPPLIDHLQNVKSNAVLVKVGAQENKGKYFKDYSRLSRLNILNVFKVSSIEIVAQTSFIREMNVRFNEKLGLGTDMPSCEENLFIYQLLRKSHGSNPIDYYHEILCFHTTIIESRNIDHQKRFVARGYLLGHVNVLLSIIAIYKVGVGAKWSCQCILKSNRNV